MDRQVAPGLLLRLLALACWCVASHTASDTQRAPPTDAEELVILDCDPTGLSWSGLDVDDDLALLALVASASGCNPQQPAASKIRVVGVTTVAGNGPQRHTHEDASYLMRRLNLSIPVLRGAAWWPPPLDSWRPRGKSAASDFIVKTVLQNADKRVTVLALGPLSNVAAALDSEPTLAGRLRRVIIMVIKYLSLPVEVKVSCFATPT